VSSLILLAPAAYLPGAGGAGATPPPGLEVIFNTALKMDFPFWLATRIARHWMIKAVLGTPPQLLDGVSAAERAQVSKMLESVLPVSSRRLGLLNDAKVTTHLQRFALERVAVPTLIFSAQDDLYGTYERARYTAGEIPGARFVGYETGGHLLVGRRAAVTAEMLKHLQK
jgi:pimeloyl-ACP methyl ester carboxylesterase